MISYFRQVLWGAVQKMKKQGFYSLILDKLCMGINCWTQKSSYVWKRVSRKV